MHVLEDRCKYLVWGLFSNIFKVQYLKGKARPSCLSFHPKAPLLKALSGSIFKMLSKSQLKHLIFNRLASGVRGVHLFNEGAD